MEKKELRIASGQASEELHRRYQSLQLRTNGLERQLQPVIQSFAGDLAAFERDLATHIIEAVEVLKRASTIAVSSNEAY